MSAKTHKGLTRRLKVTKSGKIMHARTGRRHLLSNKSAKRKRQLRRWAELPPGEVRKLQKQYDFR